MDIEGALADVDEAELRAETAAFLQNFMTPAFGSLPKREIELGGFDLLRNLGILQTEATIYSLMTDLKVTRTKASQLIFDLEIRRHGSDRARLDDLVKQALIETKFARDGDYFVMEIENPLTIAHMRQRIREVGHFSDTSFNSSLVRAPLSAVTDLMLSIIPDDQHQAIKAALTSLETVMLDDHLENCVESALKGNSLKARREKVEELVAVLGGRRK